MRTSQSFCRSCLVRRIYSTLSQPKRGFKRNVTNSSVDSNYQVQFTQKQPFRYNHTIPDIPRDYHLHLHTEGLIKTIIKNTRALYNELRDDFKRHRAFNSILVVVIISYTATILGRLYLEYRKDAREEKQIDIDHVYKMAKLGMPPGSNKTPKSLLSVDKTSSSTNKQ